MDLGAEDRIVGSPNSVSVPITCAGNAPGRRHQRGQLGRHHGPAGPTWSWPILEENDAQDVMALEIAGIPCWVCDVRSVERAFACSRIWGSWWGAGEGEQMARVREHGHRDGRIFTPFQKGGLCGLAFSLDVGGIGCLHPGLCCDGGVGRHGRNCHGIPNAHGRLMFRAGWKGCLLPSEPFPFKESHLEECARPARSAW